ncbi:MAG: hypothetical protein V3S69_05480 [Dehalococcoidales bacterium]
MGGKEERYLVSIQWGSGHHYFVTPKPVIRARALEIMEGHARSVVHSIGRRGALPTVKMLQIMREVAVERPHD